MNRYFFDVCAVSTADRSWVISPNADNIAVFLTELSNQISTQNYRLVELDCLIELDDMYSRFDSAPDHHIEFAINRYAQYVDCFFHAELETWFENYSDVTENNPPTQWNEPNFFRWVLSKKIGIHKLKCLFLLLPLSITNGYLVIKYPEKVLHFTTIGKMIHALTETHGSMRMVAVLNIDITNNTTRNQGARFAENVKHINLF